MANLNTYATATPVLTDYASGVDDPGGTWSVKNFTFSAIRDLLQANLTSATIGSDVKLERDAANTLALRNSTNGQVFNIYNTYTDASNYERFSAKWGGNSLYLQTEAAGTGSIRNISISGNGTDGDNFLFSGHFARIRDGFLIYVDVGRVFDSHWHNGLRFRAGNSTDESGLYWGTSISTPGGNAISLVADFNNVLCVHNDTSGSAFRIYNSYSSAGTNYERAGLRWNTNVFEIGSFAGGTGTLRGMMVGVSGNSLGFLGATPIAQYSTTGTTTGFTAGAGTAVNDDSTFTGNTGATAYTIGDVVRALKQYGLIAS